MVEQVSREHALVRRGELPKEEVYGLFFWGNAWEGTKQTLAEIGNREGLTLPPPVCEGAYPVKKFPLSRAGDPLPERSQDRCDDRKIKSSARGMVGVCDGVSTGHGAIAAEVASRILWEMMGTECEDIPERCARAFAVAQKSVRFLGENPEYRGAATTATLVKIARDKGVWKAYIAHVGDSRAYLVRNGKITLLTRDDSKMQNVLSKEKEYPPERIKKMDQFASWEDLDEEERRWIQQRAMVTKSLGMKQGDGEVLEPRDVIVLHLEAGDRLMVVSDGVSDNLLEAEMEKILAEKKSDLSTEEEILSATRARMCEKLQNGKRHDRAKVDDATVAILSLSEIKE